MDSEPKLDASQLPCFLEQTKIGELLRNMIKLFLERIVPELLAWSEPEKCLMVKPMHLGADELEVMFSLQGPQGVVDQSSVRN